MPITVIQKKGSEIVLEFTAKKIAPRIGFLDAIFLYPPLDFTGFTNSLKLFVNIFSVSE